MPQIFTAAYIFSRPFWVPRPKNRPVGNTGQFPAEWAKNSADEKKYAPRKKIKGLSYDRFKKFWQNLTEIGLNKGRRWLLKFSEAPLIFIWNLKGLSHEIDANLTIHT
jgi:hypothetical protein